MSREIFKNIKKNITPDFITLS